MPICLARRCLWTDKTDPTSVGLVRSQFTNFILPTLSLISSFVLPSFFCPQIYMSNFTFLSLERFPSKVKIYSDLVIFYSYYDLRSSDQAKWTLGRRQ